MKKSLFCLFAFLLLAAGKCFSQKVWKENIPQEYIDCSSCILIVIKKEDDLNKRMHNINGMVESRFLDEYIGKKVFITRKELDSNKVYSDKNLYRFILDTHTYGVTSSQWVDKGNGRTEQFESTSGALNIHFIDRIREKKYLQLSNWAGWKKNFEKVVEALNKIQKSKQPAVK